MIQMFFALLSLASAYFVALGVTTLHLAGSTGETGVDLLIGATALIAGALLAVLAYTCRPA